MSTIDSIYRDLCLKGKYDEKYSWKQRESFENGDHTLRYMGGSLDICEYLSKTMRKKGYETYIVFTKRDYEFLHAAIVYKPSKENKYYIADPTTDLKEYQKNGLNDISFGTRYLSKADEKRAELLEQSNSGKRNIDEYIKEFGTITLSNITLEDEATEYFNGYDELIKGIEEASKFYQGFNKYKLNINGTYYDDKGYDYRGLNRRGFNREGIHYKTNKPYNERGLNKSGHFDYDEDGYNIFGFNRYQRHKNGTYYDDEGFDYRGLNRKGFNRSGLHYKTDAPFNEKGYRENGEYFYDEEGYDYLGFDKLGRDREGFDKKGFNEDGLHRNGSKYDDNGRDKDGYYEDGYDEQGVDKEGYNKDGYNKYGVDREGINRETGEKDSRISLVEDFINSNISRKLYCKQKNINISDFNKILKEISSIYPNIGITPEDIQKEAQKSSAIYLAKREKIANALLNGELTFDGYCHDTKGVKIEDLLIEVKGTDKEIRLYRILGNGFISEKRDMMDYIRVFEKEEYDNGTYKRTMQKFINFERGCLQHKELLDIYKKLKNEEKRLGTYKRPFNKNECGRVGYQNNDTGKVEFMEITDEHIQYAKQHLRNTGKYICGSNMQEVFSKFARGELSFDDIEEERNNATKHTSNEIAEGINPSEGEIEGILEETMAEQDRVNNSEQEKKGQTQGDN